MPSFALITEGITDQVALELILEGHYRGRAGDGIDVNPLQPARDATDQARLPPGAFGGWELVLEFCSAHERIREALAFNDYLIIQIDTDCGDQPKYGVPLTLNGQQRPVPELIQDVRARIVGQLGADLYAACKGLILCAVCVHALECWLIPLHETRADRKLKTDGCAGHLQRALSRAKMAYAKDYGCYSQIANGYRRRGIVAQNVQYNESFGIFIDSLPDLAG